MVELVCEVKALIHDEMRKADSNAGDGLTVERHHAEAEGNGDQEVDKIIKVEAPHGAATRGGECASDAEPANQNYGKGAEHVVAHGFEHRRIVGHQLR